MTSEAHKKLSKQEFVVCPESLFTDNELVILQRHGRWMFGLMRGEIFPETDAQRRFVGVCHGQAQPETIYEHTWLKYVARKKWELENPDYVGARGIGDADFGLSGQTRAEIQDHRYLLARLKHSK